MGKFLGGMPECSFADSEDGKMITENEVDGSKMLQGGRLEVKGSV
jgi:hypothetical protein